MLSHPMPSRPNAPGAFSEWGYAKGTKGVRACHTQRGVVESRSRTVSR